MQSEYDPLTAATVAHAYLPLNLRQQLTLEDVFYMLYQEFQYHESTDKSQTVVAAHSLSQAELIVAYIQGAAEQDGRSYSNEQIAYVLKGEDVYLQQIGLLDA